jgi:type III restriction enzyme
VNESYKDFVTGLQQELHEAGFSASETQPTSNARERISLIPDAKVLTSKEFNVLWDRIKKQIKPQYNFDSKELVSLISKTLLAINKDDVKATRLEGTRTEVIVDESGIKTGETDSELIQRVVGDRFANLVEALSSETNITKETILKAIELKSPDEIIRIYKNNPAKFIEVASMRMRDEVAAYGSTVLSYIKIDKPDLSREDIFKTITAYKDKTAPSKKSVYQYASCDSETEKAMVSALESNKSVKLYVKFPDGYRIPTPNGNYNPDWGVVIERDGKLLPFILETKNTMTGDWIDRSLLTKNENIKIDSAKIAYEESLNIHYIVGKSLKDVLSSLQLRED